VATIRWVCGGRELYEAEKTSRETWMIFGKNLLSIYMKRLGKLDYIDRNILSELVDAIYITEEREIKIIFKYKNLYEDAMRYLK